MTTNPTTAAAVIDEAVFNQAVVNGRTLTNMALDTEIQTAQTMLQDLYNEAQGPNGFDYENITSVSGGTGEKVEKLVNVHSTLAGLKNAKRTRETLEATAARLRNGEGFPEEPSVEGLMPFDEHGHQALSLYDQVMAQLPGNDLRAIQNNAVEIDLIGEGGRNRHLWNALFEVGDLTPAGSSFLPEITRDRSGLTRAPTRIPTILDIIPRVPTSQSAYEYMLQTTAPAEATAVAEGAATAENTIKYTPQLIPTQDIATRIPVTLRMLEDELESRGILETDLMEASRRGLETQAMQGNNTAPQLNGLLRQIPAGGALRLTVADGALENILNMVLAAQTRAEIEGQTMVDYTVVNRIFWQYLIRQESASGGYHVGSPFLMPVPMVWGVPVVPTTMFGTPGANTYMAIAGNFGMFSRIVVRRDLQITSGTVDDDFAKRQINLMAVTRAAMVVRRPQAFAALRAPTAGTGAPWSDT